MQHAFWNRPGNSLSRVHRSGCFDSYITYILYLVGCVLFTSLHGASIRFYFVGAEDKVTALQSGYGVSTVKLRRDVALSIVSIKRRQ